MQETIASNMGEILKTHLLNIQFILIRLILIILQAKCTPKCQTSRLWHNANRVVSLHYVPRSKKLQHRAILLMQNFGPRGLQ